MGKETILQDKGFDLMTTFLEADHKFQLDFK